MKILKNIYKTICTTLFILGLIGLYYLTYFSENINLYGLVTVRRNVYLIFIIVAALVVVLMMRLRFISAATISYILYNNIERLDRIVNRIDLYFEGHSFFYTYHKAEFMSNATECIADVSGNILITLIILTIFYILYKSIKNSNSKNKARTQNLRSTYSSSSYNRYNDYDDDDYDYDRNRGFFGNILGNTIGKFYYPTNDKIGEDSYGRSIYKDPNGKYVTVDSSGSIADESYTEPYDMTDYNTYNSYDSYNSYNDSYYNNDTYSSSYGFDGYNNYSDYYGSHLDDY